MPTTNETKHTPGPWRADGFDVVRDGSYPEGGNKEFHLATTGYALADPDVRRANARLIAAAPELLEVLLLIDETIGDAIVHEYDKEHQTRIGAAMFRARAAIAKAEGRAS